jgi:hypothetical protein
MKNVQVIDGANNCTYSIFSFTEEEFRIVFPEQDQDIEFIEDVIKRVGNKKLGELLKPVWKRMVSKKDVHGIHGTLFYELEFKKKYYPTKKDSEMITGV